MFLIVGLGNPGRRYVDTRHNIGFNVVESLAGSRDWRPKYQGELAELEHQGEKHLLLKPQTFMNESGQSVGPAARFYRLPPASVMVVHDELDLPFGSVRLKLGGGDAGHNGLRSIRAHLGTGDFIRVRVGIGKPPPGFRGDTADYVLQAFAPAEQGARDQMVEAAVSAVLLIIDKGLGPAMNVVNQRK